MVNSDIITNKKDLKIHKSSEILSTIFDISPDAIALTRVSDGKFIDCNQEYLNQIGYSQEEVIGHTSEELNLYVDENRQKYANEILIKKTATNFELKIRRKDGTIIHVLYSGRLIDVEGEQTLLNIGKNITERKKVEQQIKDNADLMDQLYDAVIRTDTNFKINYWNKAAEKMFGYSQDETLGNNSTELLSPIYAPGERETKSEELKKKGTLKTINKFKHKNGSDIIVEQNATQINDNSGVPISYVVVYQDITDLKKAENKQETLSKQLQLALDASSLGWWHYNPITDISTYDNRYKEIFGVLGSKRPNDEILKLLHPDDLPQVLSKVEKALDPVNPRKYYAKYRIYHNNEIRWIEAHGITTFEGHRDTKHAVSLVGTVNDITERKRF
jgi:PAS domain S-box-containing protein